MLSDWLLRMVELVQGHHVLADEPDWSGTFEEFLNANPDTTFDEIKDAISDFERGYGHRIGGGAQGCFTLRLIQEPQRGLSADEIRRAKMLNPMW